ncbi:MAG: methyltransferase [Alphaproteobacteria bacterium]
MTETPDQDYSEDTLLGGRVRLRQPRRGYRAAVDPVLLAASVPTRAGERVLDVGVGTGAATLCLAARVKGLAIVGLEVQPDLADLARGNVELNGCAASVSILDGDVMASPPGLTEGSFHQVMTNPPYGAEGTRSPESSRDLAHGAADLERWLTFCVRMLRHKGWLTVIHRADHLDRVVSLLQGHLGGIELLPVWPREGEPARRVIIRGRRGVATPATLFPGLVLHDDHGYTDRAHAVLWDGRAFDAKAESVQIPPERP